jgi:WD40 repeat protein
VIKEDSVNKCLEINQNYNKSKNTFLTVGSDKTIKFWEGGFSTNQDTIDKILFCLKIKYSNKIYKKKSILKQILLNIKNEIKLEKFKQLNSFRSSYVVCNVIQIKWAKDDHTFVTSGKDINIHVWDFKTGKIIQTLMGHETLMIRALAQLFWKENMTTIISGGDDSLIKIWDIESGQNIHTINYHFSFIRTVLSFTNKNNFFIGSCSDDRKIKFYDVENKKEAKSFSFHNEAVNDMLNINWIKDKVTFASCDDNSCVIIWNFENGKVLHNLYLNNGMALCLKQIYLENEMTIIACGLYGSAVKLIDVEKGKCIFSYSSFSLPVKNILQIGDGNINNNNRCSIIVTAVDLLKINLLKF